MGTSELYAALLKSGHIKELMTFPHLSEQRTTSGAFKIFIIWLSENSLCLKCLENWLETTYLTKQPLIYSTLDNFKKTSSHCFYKAFNTVYDSNNPLEIGYITVVCYSVNCPCLWFALLTENPAINC